MKKKILLAVLMVLSVLSATVALGQESDEQAERREERQRQQQNDYRDKCHDRCRAKFLSCSSRDLNPQHQSDCNIDFSGCNDECNEKYPYQ